MKLLVAIPALNEHLTISKVIEQVQAELPTSTALVVDDGSTDDTAKFALAAGAKVISIPFNVGVGGAMRVAFKYALANNFSHVVQIDADGQHLPSEVEKLLKADSSSNIVIGSRFMKKDGQYKVGGVRRSAMLLLAFITGKICKSKLTDVTSGFRLTSGKAIELFAYEYPREYLGDTVESLIIAHRSGIKISEVPVNMNYREGGNPSQNTLKSIWHLIRALLIIFLAIFKSQSKTKRLV
jgi:glycosyltransferase involved in cell wall biosynthesis